jgi:hypothetical protein
MKSIYKRNEEIVSKWIDKAQAILTPYEMFNLFIDSMTKNKKMDFLEDVKDELTYHGYIIFKPTNLADEIKIEEFKESMNF